jgi:hypothetical protein
MPDVEARSFTDATEAVPGAWDITGVDGFDSVFSFSMSLAKLASF